MLLAASAFVSPASATLIGDTISATGHQLTPISATIGAGSEFTGINGLINFDFGASTLTLTPTIFSPSIGWGGHGFYVFADFDDQITSLSISSNTGFTGGMANGKFTFDMHSIILVYSKTRQTKRRGTSVTLKSPEAIIRKEVPALRIVSPELWDRVQKVNAASTAATWRAPDGRLKSRPTESKHLLTPFLSCGECGGSFYVRVDNGKEFLHCTNRHHFGKMKCSNGHRLSVALAEKAIMQAFESALVGDIVMTKIAEALEAHREAQQDPVPLQAEAKRLRAEIARLVDLAARGEEVEVLDGIRTRKARLAEIEETLSGTAAVEIDMEAFRADVEAALTDWRAHLKKNPSTTQQVLRKLLPERLRVTPSPKPGVLWEFDGMTDYKKILEECGLAPVIAAVEHLAKVSRGVRPS